MRRETSMRIKRLLRSFFLLSNREKQKGQDAESGNDGKVCDAAAGCIGCKNTLFKEEPGQNRKSKKNDTVDRPEHFLFSGLLLIAF